MHTPESVVLLDVDNCIANDHWRIPFINFSKEDMDERYDIYHKLSPWDEAQMPPGWGSLQHLRVVLVTARPVWLKEATIDWFIRNFGRSPTDILMRNIGCSKPSAEIKVDQLKHLFSGQMGNYEPEHVVAAFDDRPDVIEAYQRHFGIRGTVHAIHDVCAMTPPAAQRSPSTVPEILRDAANIFEQRNAAYKDNYKRVGEVLHGLFPDGITLQGAEQFNLWHLFELAVVKMTRLTNSRFEHRDSAQDMINYMAMVQSLSKEGLFK